MTTEAAEIAAAIAAVETADGVETVEDARSDGDTGAGSHTDPERRHRHRRAEHAIAAIHGEAARVERREVDELLATLDARGELDDDRRTAIEALADAIVDQLLAVPTRSLRVAAADDDGATIDTALELFDPTFGAGPGNELEGGSNAMEANDDD